MSRQYRPFREWLIERLTHMPVCYGSLGPEADADIEAQSLAMGVRPEVLREARRRIAELRIKAGRQDYRGDKRAGSNHYQADLDFPQQLWPLWQDEARRRGLKGSALLRSMIHAYLMGSWEPESRTRQWVVHGHGYAIADYSWEKQHGRSYPYRERALVTTGARRALVRRANQLGITPTAVMRQLVCSVLEGKWGAPGTFPITDAVGMYEDETRYYLG